MNYSMQGMTKVIPELFVMLKSTKVEIKKNIKCWWLTRPLQVLMVDKTTSFKKRAKGRRGTSRRTASKLLLKWRSPSLVLSLRLSASTAKGLVTGSGNYPKWLADKKDGKVNISIFDIHVIDVYFTSVYSNPSVFDTSSVAKISNSKRELQNKQRLVKGEVTMCVGSGSKIDMIIIAHSLYFRD